MEKVFQKKEKADNMMEEASQKKKKASEMMEEASQKKKRAGEMMEEASQKKGEVAKMMGNATEKQRKEIRKLEKDARKLEKDARKLEKDAGKFEKDAGKIEDKATELIKKAAKILEEATDSRVITLESLQNYRDEIRGKQRRHIILILLLVLVFCAIASIMLGYIPSGIIERTKDFMFGDIINSHIFTLNIRRISAILLLWLVLLLVIYAMHLVVKNFRRYQNALNKLNLLIMRLELYTDKDLLISSRLDRELEMIYRILES